MIRALVIVLLVALGTPAWAQSVSFPSVTVMPCGSPAGPEVKGWIYRPSGDGPFPAIILAHSCAGANPHTDALGQVLVSWGYLVLAPDPSVGAAPAARTTPNVVTPNMRVADIAGALPTISATRPDVVKGKVGIIGHSHGGSTVIRSAQKNFGLAQRGLVAGVAYYPGCNPQFDGGIDIPVLLLAGEKDDWTPADRCRTLVSASPRGSLVDAVYYPNAYHSFDSKVADRNVPGAAAGGIISPR